MAQPVSEIWSSWNKRSSPTGPAKKIIVKENQRGSHAYSKQGSARSNPLEPSIDGKGGGHYGLASAANLAGGRYQTRFAEKVTGIVGLYLNLPDNTSVSSVDEKTRIQLLDRTQTLLPLSPGQIARRTHDLRDDIHRCIKNINEMSANSHSNRKKKRLQFLMQSNALKTSFSIQRINQTGH
jgi:hypothetical protein